jgi:hypothetical protein
MTKDGVWKVSQGYDERGIIHVAIPIVICTVFSSDMKHPIEPCLHVKR